MYEVRKFEGDYLVWIPNSKDGWIFHDLLAANAGCKALNSGKWFSFNLEKPSQILFL